MFDFLNGPVRDLVTAIYEAVGYVGVALWVAIESVVIPIPSELVLPFAGFLAADPTSVEPITGQPWTIPLLVAAATVGSLLGALIAYAIGFYGGRPALTLVLEEAERRLRLGDRQECEHCRRHWERCRLHLGR